MISPLAVVETADVGAGASVAEFAIVRSGARLGEGVVVHAHAVVERGAVIGAGTEIFPGAVVGKEPNGAGAVARRPVFERWVVVGAHASIGAHAVLYYDVEIGEQSLVGDAASIREQCRIGARAVIGRHATLNYGVRVGDRTKVMDHAWLGGNMTIGSDVLVAGGVLAVNDNALGRDGYRAEALRGPTIEDGASIGAGAKLLPGIVIGRSAIVAAGAVVTRDVQPETVVMGVPARVVRKVEAA